MMTKLCVVPLLSILSNASPLMGQGAPFLGAEASGRASRIQAETELLKKNAADDKQEKDPQVEVLFEAVDVAKTPLDESQTRVLNRIKNLATTASEPFIFRLQPGVLQGTGVVRVTLPGGVALDMTGYKVTQEQGYKSLHWKDDTGASVSIVFHDTSTSASGLIYTSNAVYSVEPIGKGLSLAVKFDQTKIPDHPSKH